MIAVIEYTDAAQLLADAKARRAMFYAPRPEPEPEPIRRGIGARFMPRPHDHPKLPDHIRHARMVRDWIEHATPPEALRPSDGRMLRKLVAERCGVREIDLISERRTADVIVPRHIACYVLRHCTTLSLPAIGRLLGNRDHTTILNGIRVITGRLEHDRKIKAKVRDILAEVALIRAEEAKALEGEGA